MSLLRRVFLLGDSGERNGGLKARLQRLFGGGCEFEMAWRGLLIPGCGHVFPIGLVRYRSGMDSRRRF